MDRRRMNDLREEIGKQFSLTGRITKRWMMWAGHLVQMEEDRLLDRAEGMKQRVYGKRGRPQLRWDDCLKRYVRKTEEDDRWREKAADREKWKGITAGEVQQYMD